jgi:class 3 adenylate cyclase
MARTTRLTASTLARRAGTSSERIERLVSIGVLQPDAGGRFAAADVQRARIVDAFERGGIELRHIERAIRDGRMSFDFTDRIDPGASAPSGTSLGDLMVELGPNGVTLPDVFVALGRPRPEPDRELTEADIAALRLLVRAWTAPPLAGEPLLRAARLLGDSTRRLAEGWVKLFMEAVALPPEQGAQMTVEELRPRLIEPSIRAAEALEPAVTWLVRYHLEQTLNAVNIESMEVALEASGERAAIDRQPPAIVFADISGFTRLTEEHGDALAVSHAETLAAIATGVAATASGRLVKQLGDGVMLAFESAADAIRAAEDLRRAAVSAELPPVHTGISAGPVIERDGDYYGRTVNLASRLSGVAGPGEIVLNEAAARLLPRERVAALSPATIKGFAAPIRAFRLNG